MGEAAEDDEWAEMERFFLAAEVLARRNVSLAAERKRETRFRAVDEVLGKVPCIVNEGIGDGCWSAGRRTCL